MASASLSSNKLKLNHLTINNYNRHNACESQKQFIKSVQDYSIKTRQSPVDITDDVFSLKSLPPKHQLMKWSTELSMRNNIASGIHYIECNLGKFMYESVQHLIALHRVQEMKLAVDQELTWFNSPKLVPKSISIFPSQNLIEKFKEVLLRRPANKEISEYVMNPNTLAELCCARWLSSDHMLQISSILNSIQGHSKNLKCGNQILKVIMQHNMFYLLVKRLIKMVGKYHTINATEVDFINALRRKD
ncbi:uncharacterized protein LOC136083711 [Hydra vulgaris]|uniref:Uncharacterized protein LOC136083711 n=1 Tax=Hydra vulgaris TaxID=6087 RepID=A0ABM4CCI6_HYDVU